MFGRIFITGFRFDSTEIKPGLIVCCSRCWMAVVRVVWISFGTKTRTNRVVLAKIGSWPDFEAHRPFSGDSRIRRLVLQAPAVFFGPSFFYPNHHISFFTLSIHLHLHLYPLSSSTQHFFHLFLTFFQ